MNLRYKLDELNKEIQECVIESKNMIGYYPLSEKINALAEYLAVGSIKNDILIKWIEATPMHDIKECIRLCNKKIPSNSANINYKEQSIRQIKYLAGNAIWWFKKGCMDFEADLLDKEVV